MNKPVNFRECPDRTTAAKAAADLLAQSIQRSLDIQNRCAIVVSGGSTPGPCFNFLSAKPLAWAKVTVVPSDERWVSPDHPDSNEKMIREHLLINAAGAGQLLPLFRDGMEASDAINLIAQDMTTLALPFAAVLLGMGEDGHFASLFPDYAGLDQALNPNSESLCMLIKTAGSPHLRISLSLSALLNTTHTVLLIYGAAKRKVFEAAERGGSGFPIEGLLQHHTNPITVVWAP